MNSHCPKWAARVKAESKTGKLRWMFPAAGLLSLLWFLFRVVPKPSRAAYPCQRAAAPLAGGFVIWLAGAVGSASLFRQGKRLWKRSQTVLACACFAVAAVFAIAALISMPRQAAMAEPNQPVGIGKGLHPGRVVWARDPAATNWNGPGQGHWWEGSHTIQSAVDGMMSQAVQRLSGETGDRQAWNALFRNFNQTHGGGNAVYKRGEKIAIKVNFVGCIFSEGNVDPTTYDLGGRRLDYMNTSPQMILALLRQLVKNAGVNQEDISVGDPLSLFPNQYYDVLHGEFPKVHYIDHNGGSEGHPRTKVELSTVPLYWSSRPEGVTQDYLPTHYAEAKYLVNMANLKSHTMAGVTLCGKNHFGSLLRTPPQKGYFDLHASTAGRSPGTGKYRDMVDLIGHAHLGGKTLVYFIDGLYPGVHPSENAPRKWSTAPFNGTWASSLLASQDPVAIDSVGFDFLWTEWDNYPRMPGVDDYLHEAALAESPPSGTFYDPNHPVATVRLASLGVHEHWNNAQDRQYSRNLGKREGVELVRVEPPSAR
jgi:hypothetical protein